MTEIEMNMTSVLKTLARLMFYPSCRSWWTLTMTLLVSIFASACGSKAPGSSSMSTPDPQLAAHGSMEVTAELIEIPEGAIFKRDLYDYATVLKYKVLKVHRGEVKADMIYVAHYNPFKPRNEAPDARVKEIGGNLKSFRAGQKHRMALEVPADDHYMGGLVNKYFDTTDDPIYWGVWTNLE